MKNRAWNQSVSRVSDEPSPSFESLPPPSGAVLEERPSHVAVSQPGQLVTKLTQLEQQQPDKFDEVVSGLAGSLRDIADMLGGSAGKRLDKLASRLDDIAKGGEIGQLAWRAPTHYGHPDPLGLGGIDGEANGFLDDDGDSVPPPSAGALNIQQMPTLVPPPSDETRPPVAEDATPTRPWNPPPALLAFSRLDRHHDYADREAVSSALASLLDQLDAALASPGG